MTMALQFIRANLTRRRLRTAVTMGGVAIAVATVFSLLSFQRSYQAGMRADLDRLGAHLLVVPKGCPYDAASLALHGASWPCYLKSAYLQTVRNTPHVAVAAPVMMSAVYDRTTSAQIVYCGVEPDIIQVKRFWHIQGSLFSAPGELLVGSELARTNHWHLGQQIQLPGVAKGSGRVAGILAPTQGVDDLFIYMPLSDAQKVFARPNQLTHILVRLDQPDNVNQVVAMLRGCDAGMDMNVVPLAHLFNTIQDLVQSTRLLLACVALVALLAAGAGVSNTILMAVAERTREIGVLRALGGSRGQIFGLIWSETVVVCVAGGGVGIAGAVGGARVIDTWLRNTLPFSPHDALIRPEMPLILACLLGAAVLGTFASALPAWRAARLTPGVAMRAVGGAL